MFRAGTKTFVRDFLKSMLILGAASAASALVTDFSSNLANIAAIYLLAVVCISRVTAGYFWGLASSVAGVVSITYFFTYPYFTFDVTLDGAPITAACMLVASVLTSTLTVHVKEQARQSALREKRTETLYEISKKLLTVSGMEGIETISVRCLSRFAQRTAVFYAKDPALGGTAMAERLRDSAENLFTETETRAVHKVFTDNVICGHGTACFAEAGGLYFPVSVKGKVVAAMGLFYGDKDFPEKELVTSLNMVVAQVSMALERQILADRQQEIALEAKTERLRTNLLRSVSHDLRTPLTSIIGASSAILENRDRIDRETRRRLVSDINKEAKWLIHMVENLLAVTRISADPIRLAKSPEAAEEIASEAVRRVRTSYPGAEIRVKVPEEFLLVPMDATLIEQVIINLLENSIQHSGSEAPTELEITADGENAVFTVRDRGRGISQEELPFLFEGDRPGQGKKSDSSRGMGIGLSICKSIVRAHGGTITALNGETGGAVFTFTLPLKEDAPNEQ